MFNFPARFNKFSLVSIFCTFIYFIFPTLTYAVGASQEPGTASAPLELIFIFLAVMLVSAKIGGIVEKFGQPSVVGELIAGITLSIIGYLGIHSIDLIRHNHTIEFFAELGAVLLLFQIGLESNITQMKKVGLRAFMVAIIGVILPFVLGTFILGPLVFPNQNFVTYLFIGAALVATSVGITAAVYQSLGILKAKASQTVLGAAVIDDVLGLLVLAIVSAIAQGGQVTPQFVMILSIKALGFLIGAIALGGILAKTLSYLFSRIHTGVGMKVTLALTFALCFAYLASIVGLAPIVGAFAAGLILDQVHFKNFDVPAFVTDIQHLKGFDSNEKAHIDEVIHKHQHSHVEQLISHIGILIIPIFFVYTGLLIDASSLLNPSVYLGAFIISVGAIIGKLAAGLAAEGSWYQKLFVGTSMIPRGEVGLIFASVGKSLGAIPDNVFSTIILVIIISTLLPPAFIKKLAVHIKKD